MKKTDKQFKEEIKALVNDEYTFLDPYINCKKPLTVIHNKCNHIYKVRPDNFLQGYRCPNCRKTKIGDKLRMSNDEFKQKVFNLVGDEYTVLGDYVNNNTKIKMKHNTCNTIYEVAPEMFIGKKQRRCPYCKGKILKEKFSYTNDDFIKKVLTDEYVLINNYINTHTKVTLKHTICDKEFTIIPNDFKSGQRCPYCFGKKFKGEELIAEWLTKHEIPFNRQYKFDDLKYKRKLSFDFEIPCENNEHILIEFDGKQHSVQSFNETTNDFNLQKIRDSLKDEYCNKRKDIDFYRISYKDINNIDIILENIFNKYK